DRAQRGLPDPSTPDADIPEPANDLQPPRRSVDGAEPGPAPARPVHPSSTRAASASGPGGPVRRGVALLRVDQRPQREPDASLPMVPGKGGGRGAFEPGSVVGPGGEVVPRVDPSGPPLRAGGRSPGRPTITE